MLHNIDNCVVKYLRNTIINIVKHLQAKDIYGYLGRGKVFRHDIAKIQPYKGGRSSLKPVNLQLIEEMLLERFNAKIATDNLEADDWQAIVTGKQIGRASCRERV